jgi:WD40 repeat protein
MKINVVAWSFDGQFIASGSDDCTLRIWDPESGKCIKIIEDSMLSNGNDHVMSLAWNPNNNKYIAVGNSNSLFTVFNVITGYEVASLSDYNDSINSISWSPDGYRIASGSSDKRVIIKDFLYNNSKTIEYINHKITSEHPDIVTSVSWSPNSKLVVSGCNDGNLRIFYGSAKININYELGKIHGSPLEYLMIINGNNTTINSVCWSYDNSYIISGGSDKILRIWEVNLKNKSSECISEFKGHKYPILDLSSINLKNNNLKDKKVISCDSSSIGIWNISNFENIKQKYKKIKNNSTVNNAQILRIKNKSSIEKASWSPDGTKIITCGDSSDFYMYNSVSGSLIMTIVGNTETIKCIEWSPNGKYIATGSFNNLIIHDINGSIIEILTGHNEEILSLSWNPVSENFIASGSEDGKIYIWNIQDKTIVARFEKHRKFINSLSWNPDGYMLASCSDDNKLIIWKMPESNNSLEIESTEIEYPDAVFSLSWDPSGSYIVSGCSNGRIYLIDVINGIIIQSVIGVFGKLHPASRTFTSGIYQSLQGSAVNQQHESNINNKNNEMLGITTISWNNFEPSYIASGGFDGTIRIWKFESGLLGETCIGEFKESSDTISMMSWNSSGDRILYCNSSPTVFILDAITRSFINKLNFNQSVQEFSGQEQGININRRKSGGFKEYFNSLLSQNSNSKLLCKACGIINLENKSKSEKKSQKLIDTFKKSDLVKVAKNHNISLKSKDKTLKTKLQLFTSLKRKKLI